MNLSNQPKSNFVIFIKSLGFGLYSFFLLIAICFVIILFNNGFELKNIELWLNSKSGIIISTVIQCLTLFVIPPILYSYYLKENFFKTFSLTKKDKFYKYFLAIVVAISLFPLLVTLEGFIEKIPFSSDILVKAVSQKQNLEKALNLLFEGTDLLSFLLVFILVSLIAGFSEELFFRGLLLPILITHTNYIIFGIIFGISLALVFSLSVSNGSIIIVLAALMSLTAKNASLHHKEYLGVFLSSLVFSVMHFSIFHFAPILIAGFVFGYVALKSKNLKMTIFMHSFFNGMQLILNYLYQIKVVNFDIEKEVQFPVVYLIISFAILLSSLYFLTKQNEHLPHTS
jgi:membrane protease YdiL (CAAX protease family)